MRFLTKHKSGHCSIRWNRSGDLSTGTASRFVLTGLPAGSRSYAKQSAAGAESGSRLSSFSTNVSPDTVAQPLLIVLDLPWDHLSVFPDDAWFEIDDDFVSLTSWTCIVPNRVGSREAVFRPARRSGTSGLYVMQAAGVLLLGFFGYALKQGGTQVTVRPLFSLGARYAACFF